ncbi:hypothetical protein AB0A77_30900 [Streptomyces varsoviensis]|uniref:hypothetical protein n=1 Tax=Streptomyces varsoviensis TaxID=67373 RepID=UPI003403E569
MRERIVLDAVKSGGGVEKVTLEPASRPPYELDVTRAGRGRRSFAADNLFACLLGARRELEGDGLLLCCQGARLDVTNSGMQAQMTGGRFVYTFDPSSRVVNDETVDIFAPADADQVATVEDQRKAIYAFFGIGGRGDSR